MAMREGPRSALLRPFPAAAAALTFLAMACLAPAAQASLIGQTVGVTLTDDGALSLADDVVVAEPGAELTPGDGSQVGGVLLPLERIDVQADRIVISFEEGSPGGGTGFPAGAYYLFSNLVFFDAPTEIVGIQVSSTNLSNLAPITFTADGVTVPLDGILIGEIPGVDTGSVTIVLDMVVPEPATALLLTAGSVALAFARRRLGAR
jgi:hypothetical protein